MSTAIPPPATNPWQQLIAMADALWNYRLSEYWEGEYVTEDDAPQLSPVVWSWWRRILDPRNTGNSEVLITFCRVPTVLFDLLEIVVRILLLPFVWLLWRLEKACGGWLGIAFYCPHCHHSTRNPYVYCPECDRVHGRLRPTLAGLFVRRCSGCGKTRWAVLGNYLCWRPNHLICRNTRRSFGCYRPNPLDLPKPCKLRHIVLAGAGVRAKHAVLAQAVHQAVNGRAFYPHRSTVPWNLNSLEADLLRRQLAQSYSTNTLPCEQLGERHTLAKSLLLQSTPRKAVVLHHLAYAWLLSETELFKRGPNWASVRGLAFVVDLDEAAAESRQVMLSHSMAFERIVRATQSDVPLEPNSYLPLKVAVIVPWGQTPLTQRLNLGTHRSEEEVETLIRRFAPSLHAVLRGTVPPHARRFFGGVIGSDLSLEKAKWLEEAWRWLG